MESGFQSRRSSSGWMEVSSVLVLNVRPKPVLVVFIDNYFIIRMHQFIHVPADGKPPYFQVLVTTNKTAVKSLLCWQAFGPQSKSESYLALTPVFSFLPMQTLAEGQVTELLPPT